ncbi:MAG: cobalt ECF transporter T component CbiQ [Dongiaceae bacterium]
MRLIDRHAQTGPLRRQPAAEKLLLAFGLMVLALASPTWATQALVLATALAMILGIARVPAADLGRTMAVPVGFILAGTLVQAVSLRWAAGLPAPEVTGDALRRATFTGLRAMACVTALLGLALTTPLSDILQLLRRAGLGREIGDVALLMFRLVWVLLDCVESGVAAQASRLGYSSRRRRIRSLGLLLAALLPRVLGRARRLEQGLGARGYEGELRFLAIGRPVSRRRLAGILGLLVVLGLLGRMTI